MEITSDLAAELRDYYSDFLAGVDSLCSNDRFED